MSQARLTVCHLLMSLELGGAELLAAQIVASRATIDLYSSVLQRWAA